MLDLNTQGKVVWFEKGNLYLRFDEKGNNIIPFHGWHIVLSGEREMDKMQFGSQFNPFQSTIAYLPLSFFTKWKCKNDIDDAQKITRPLSIGVISIYLLKTRVWKRVGKQDIALEMKNLYPIIIAVFISYIWLHRSTIYGTKKQNQHTPLVLSL